LSVAPGKFVFVDDKAPDSVERRRADVGRCEVTPDPADSRVRRTPSLRNMTLTFGGGSRLRRQAKVFGVIAESGQCP